MKFTIVVLCGLTVGCFFLNSCAGLNKKLSDVELSQIINNTDKGIHLFAGKTAAEAIRMLPSEPTLILTLDEPPGKLCGIYLEGNYGNNNEEICLILKLDAYHLPYRHKKWPLEEALKLRVTHIFNEGKPVKPREK